MSLLLLVSYLMRGELETMINGELIEDEPETRVPIALKANEVKT